MESVSRLDKLESDEMTENIINRDLNHTNESNGFLNTSFTDGEKVDIPIIKVSEVSSAEVSEVKINDNDKEIFKETEMDNPIVKETRVDIKCKHSNDEKDLDRHTVGSVSFDDDLDIPKYTPRFHTKKGAKIGSENLITDGVSRHVVCIDVVIDYGLRQSYQINSCYAK